jgi:hypothetical protein
MAPEAVVADAVVADAVVADAVLAEAVAADAGAAEARAADAVAADALRRPVPVLDFLCQKELRIPAGGGPLALTADGLLVANVTERLLLRTTGTLACSGNLRFTAPPDADAAESHASSARPDALLLASGPGTLVLGPRDGVFTALALPADQGPLRVREAALFAVTAERLPTRQELGDATAGGAAAQAALWALRGPGLCVLWTAAPLRALRVVPGQACFVDPACFVGAYGELGLTARSEPGGAVYLECGGAGFVLLAPAPGSSAPGNEPTGADPLHT